MPDPLVSAIADMARSLGAEGLYPSQVLLAFCQGARDALAQTLRPGIRPEDCGDAFVLGGALLVTEALEGIYRAGITHFDAGTMTIDFKDTPARATALRILGPWMEGAAAFRSVRG